MYHSIIDFKTRAKGFMWLGLRDWPIICNYFNTQTRPCANVEVLTVFSKATLVCLIYAVVATAHVLKGLIFMISQLFQK